MRYYLHLEDDQGPCLDGEGLDLPDLEDARRVAAEGARAIVAQQVANGYVDLSGKITIANRDGQLLSAVLFSDVVQLRSATLR